MLGDVGAVPDMWWPRHAGCRRDKGQNYWFVKKVEKFS